MKRRKIRIGRIILAFVIYFIIGIIPIKISHIRTDQAKSVLLRNCSLSTTITPKKPKKYSQKPQRIHDTPELISTSGTPTEEVIVPTIPM